MFFIGKKYKVIKSGRKSGLQHQKKSLFCLHLASSLNAIYLLLFNLVFPLFCWSAGFVQFL